MADRVWDAIVVGAGGAHGSSALYHLARRGAKVLGLEAQPAAPHDQGSSHGLSRIIRLSYFESPAYLPILRESYRLWRELEGESGQKLLTLTGCVNAAPDPPAGPGLSCFHGALLAAKQHNLDHEVLTAAQLKDRFPAYRLPDGFKALYESEGGVLVPEGCISAHLAMAQQRYGAQLLCGARVLGWQAGVQLPAELAASPGAAAGRNDNASGGTTAQGGAGSAGEGFVRVDTERGSFWARKLVLAPGGWMPELVPELKPLLTVERQVVGWFELDPAHRRQFETPNFPVFLLQDANAYYYGFPADEHGFKVGRYHHRREVVDASTVDRATGPEDEAVLREAVRLYFPAAAEARMTQASVCLFTNTPDEAFLIDCHPAWPQVVLCSACSGHGFKFSSVIGSILADLALEGGTNHDISLHRLAAARPGHAPVLQALLGATAPVATA